MNIKKFTDASGNESLFQGIAKFDFYQLGSDITAGTLTGTNVYAYVDLDFNMSDDVIIFLRIGSAETVDWSGSPSTDVKLNVNNKGNYEIYDGNTKLTTDNFSFSESRLYAFKACTFDNGGSTVYRWKLLNMGSTSGSTDALTTAQVNALLALI